LPFHALGFEYIAVTYPQMATAKLDATPGSRGGAGTIEVVATQDATTVTFTAPPASPSLRAVVDVGDGVAAAPGDGVTFTLDDGDVLQLYSDAEGADLTGSSISANKPVAVFSGNVSTTYGRSANGINSPDAASEQLLPVSLWSQNYVAAWLPPQQKVGCTSLFGSPDASLWRIVASQDDTEITFTSSAPVVGVPSSSMMPKINRGAVLDYVVSGGGDFTVKANKPIAVMQGMDCEPALSGAVSTDLFMEDLVFALPTAFEHELAIVRQVGNWVALDGEPVESLASFTSAGAGTGYEVARVTIPPCYSVAAGVVPSACRHHLRGKFGLTVRGMDIVCSYAMTAQTWKHCLDTGCLQ